MSVGCPLVSFKPKAKAGAHLKAYVQIKRRQYPIHPSIPQLGSKMETANIYWVELNLFLGGREWNIQIKSFSSK